MDRRAWAGGIILFVFALTASLDRGERQRVARRASIYATVILALPLFRRFRIPPFPGSSSTPSPGGRGLG